MGGGAGDEWLSVHRISSCVNCVLAPEMVSQSASHQRHGYFLLLLFFVRCGVFFCFVFTKYAFISTGIRKTIEREAWAFTNVIFSMIPEQKY